jgi:hypothetical protein
MRWGSCFRALVGGSVLATCAAPPARGHVASACEQDSAQVCGAGDLPRVTSREWSELEVRRFVERAATGTTAVAVDARKHGVKLVSGCRLPGAYTEVRTQPGSGRLWATNRVLLFPGEVDRVACDEATHAVVAFARAAAAGATGAVSFSGVLMPLPCPTITDGKPARGCVARGLAGADRLARAKAAMKKLKTTPIEALGVTDVLEVYALAPDDDLALGFLYRMTLNTECSLRDHARWLTAQYRTTGVPGGEQVTSLRPPDDPSRPVDKPMLDAELGDRSCLHHPVFRKCFPGLAVPVDEPRRCWEPAVGRALPSPGAPSDGKGAATKP